MKFARTAILSLILGFAVLFALNTILPAVATSAAAPVRSNRTLPVCAVEDASYGPVPCVWPAFATGNGTGHSFRVYRDGHFKYITDRRAFELVGGCDSDGPLYC
jgi:hypothetical protein